MLFITSKVDVRTDAPVDEDGAAVFTEPGGRARIDVGRVEASRCPRCWRWVCATSDAPDEVCARCADALSETAAPVV
jgi:hypothetical protein